MQFQDYGLISSDNSENQVYNQSQDNISGFNLKKKKHRIIKQKCKKNNLHKKFKQNASNDEVNDKKTCLKEEDDFHIQTIQKQEELQRTTNKQYQNDKSKDQRKGRPINNPIQQQHQKISKTYNKIFHHYFRTLLFLQIIKKSPYNCHVLTLTAQQNLWLSTADKIMYSDVFPSFTQRNIIFRLPSNSLHYIFEENIRQFQKITYQQEELLYIFFGFLIKRELLSADSYQYIIKYWERVIQKCKRKINEIRNQKQSKKYKQKNQKKQDGTFDSIKQQFEKDETILASQIADYLANCCVKYDLKILITQKNQ